MQAGEKRAHLVEDLGALRLVDTLDGEVLDGLLLPPLIHRLHSAQPPAPNHRTDHKKAPKKSEIARAGTGAAPILVDPGREPGGGAELKPLGAERGEGK
jgi:hypothetical protein